MIILAITDYLCLQIIILQTIIIDKLIDSFVRITLPQIFSLPIHAQGYKFH